MKLWTLLVLSVSSAAATAQTPNASIDLTTTAGAASIHAEWRFHSVDIQKVDFRAAGADGGPSGPPNQTYDLSPRAQGRDFDDSAWTVIPADSLAERRSGGKVCFAWYRIRLTVPDTIDGVPTRGGALTLHTRVDDYAEVWVNGELPISLGQRGGNVAAGWNAPNRVLLTTDAVPGKEIQVAIFAINGPISAVPENYIWVREARVELTQNPRATAPEPVEARLNRFDSRIDSIFPSDFVVERVAEGFTFTEGPVWDRRTGRLLFSDPNANRIYEWSPGGSVGVFREQSGYAGADIAEYRQAGSNGLTFDFDDRLLVNQHGNRRIVRLEPNGTETIVVDRFEGLRLNSPNDLAVHWDGSVYFTDPSFGLPKFEDDPRRELSHNGVYRLNNGRLTLIDDSLKGPNGICFSHKQDALYVGNWDESRTVVMRYPIGLDGRVGEGTLFADLTSEQGENSIDGVKTDWKGNVYVCARGGLWIFAPDGTRLGMLENVELPHNIAWGGEDGQTLYMTCRTGVYRVRLLVSGPMP